MARKQKITIDKMTNTQLYNQTKKLVDEANKKLERLEKGVDLNKGVYNPKTKRYERTGSYTVINKNGKRIRVKQSNIVKYKANTWASKKLNERLNEYSISENKINISKNMSRMELLKVRRATKQFLISKTSNANEIIKIERRTKQNIAEELGKKATTEDIETMYSFFNDDDFKDVTKYIDPSDMWYVLGQTKYSKKGKTDSLGTYRDLISQYLDKDSLGKDVDLTNKLQNIYNKFFK